MPSSLLNYPYLTLLPETVEQWQYLMCAIAWGHKTAGSCICFLKCTGSVREHNTSVGTLAKSAQTGDVWQKWYFSPSASICISLKIFRADPGSFCELPPSAAAWNAAIPPMQRQVCTPRPDLSTAAAASASTERTERVLHTSKCLAWKTTILDFFLTEVAGEEAVLFVSSAVV